VYMYAQIYHQFQAVMYVHKVKLIITIGKKLSLMRNASDNV
jgi:hypothetical protein